MNRELGINEQYCFTRLHPLSLSSAGLSFTCEILWGWLSLRRAAPLAAAPSASLARSAEIIRQASGLGGFKRITGRRHRGRRGCHAGSAAPALLALRIGGGGEKIPMTKLISCDVL